MQFVLVTATTLVRPRDLGALRGALETNAQHLASLWGYEPPAIDVFASARTLPDFCIPIMMLDESTDTVGVLADHGWDAARHMPFLRVFVQQASGLVSGEWSVSKSTSHEILEAIVDPRCDLWTDMPGRPGVDLAFEVSDPVQDDYAIGDVLVSNFVTSSFFNARLADPAAAAEFVAAGGRFDFKGTLQRAGAIAPSGYLILRDSTHRWTENAAGEPASLSKPGAEHPLSRTERRLAG